MDVEYAFLADAAQAPQGGKLYVLGGGIDEIKAPTFPAIHPAMSLVVKLRLHATECDRDHTLRIELWGPDGEVVIPPFEGPLRVPPAPDRAAPRFFQLVWNLAGTVFPREGTYAFQVIVNGEHKKEVRVQLSAIRD